MGWTRRITDRSRRCGGGDNGYGSELELELVDIGVYRMLGAGCVCVRCEKWESRQLSVSVDFFGRCKCSIANWSDIQICVKLIVTNGYRLLCGHLLIKSRLAYLFNDRTGCFNTSESNSYHVECVLDSEYVVVRSERASALQWDVQLIALSPTYFASRRFIRQWRHLF